MTVFAGVAPGAMIFAGPGLPRMIGNDAWRPMLVFEPHLMPYLMLDEKVRCFLYPAFWSILSPRQLT